MGFKDDANVIQVSPPIVQLYKLPSEIPGVCVCVCVCACVDNGEDADAELPPI